MFGDDSPCSPSPWLNSPSSSTSPTPVYGDDPNRLSPNRLNELIREVDEGFGSLDLGSSRGRGCIIPEVDLSGHIEYKLKLLDPTPLRLAKLTTQLKFRLVEGGGNALYEIGVLDNGTIIGLSKGEMLGSLQTLGKMLAALGGGEIRMIRTFLVGGEEADSGEESGFEDFEVEQEEIGVSFQGTTAVLQERRIKAEGRPTEERDRIRAEKRLARLERKQREGIATKIWNDLSPSYTKPVKIQKPKIPQLPKEKSEKEKFKPVVSTPLGEKRWCIEAMVILKREDNSDELGVAGIEGWDFLNFEI